MRNLSEKIKLNLVHGKEIVESGIDGAKEARDAVLHSEGNTALVTLAAQKSWRAAAFGLLAGVIGGVLADDRKPLRGGVAGGLLGALLGFSGSFAWKTRPLTSAMARGASKRMGKVRDKHWLSRNPINYG
ncbi:MAG: hypothetical protein LBJ76_00390 [Candidatus Accumulibacter sp.]|jgi:hypothetical protein|nr:hypothetical protein [Accumulibacter sp.]